MFWVFQIPTSNPKWPVNIWGRTCFPFVLFWVPWPCCVCPVIAIFLFESCLFGVDWSESKQSAKWMHGDKPKTRGPMWKRVIFLWEFKTTVPNWPKSVISRLQLLTLWPHNWPNDLYLASDLSLTFIWLFCLTLQCTCDLVFDHIIFLLGLLTCHVTKTSWPFSQPSDPELTKSYGFHLIFFVKILTLLASTIFLTFHVVSFDWWHGFSFLSFIFGTLSTNIWSKIWTLTWRYSFETAFNISGFCFSQHPLSPLIGNTAFYFCLRALVSTVPQSGSLCQEISCCI